MFGTSLAIQWLRLYLPVHRGVGSIPGQGAKIPYASGPRKQKQKQYCGEFNKDFLNGPYKKKKSFQSASLCPSDQARILSHMSNRGGAKVNLC